jgi:WD40-like Beta Propeller Repeat
MAFPRLPGAFALFASSLLVVLAAARSAEGACNATCHRDIDRCMATQCQGVPHAACRRRCKPAAIRTLAYALSECRVDAAGRFSGREVLRALRGNQEPITLVDFGSSGEPVQDQVARTFCTMRGRQRGYLPSVPAFPLQRLGVSPDGSVVVFEVNQEFAIFAPPPSARLSAEEQGFFSIHADGRGLRRLGPPSHDPSFRIDIYPPAFPGEITGVAFPTPISFSPNGRRIAFTDRGPGVGGEDAIQVVVLDLATGRRTQVTHLPSGTPPRVIFGEFFLTCCPRFIDDETVVFQTFVDPDGSNPEHNLAAFTVRIDGTHFEDLPQPVVLEGSGVVPTFGVVGRHTGLLRLPLPGKPEGPPTAKPTNFPITDVFLRDGKNLTQLTDFHRADTFPAFLNADRTRAFFLAAADPVKTNPSKSCQMFSINTLGRGLRQVTHFKGDPGIGSCFAECCTGGIGYGWYRVIIQDPVTKAVIFESTYDPLGANRHGGQLFAIRPDGSGLRQLTDAAGFTTNPDGSIRVELPGPFAYSAALH